MEFYEVLFGLQFVVLIGIFFYTLWRIVAQNRLDDITLSIIPTVGGLLTWGVGLILTIIAGAITATADSAVPMLLFPLLFSIETIFLILLVLFFILSMFFYLRAQSNKIFDAWKPTR